MRLDSLAVHAGEHRSEPKAGGDALVSPIVLSTVFRRNESGEFDSGYSYTRADNPNRTELEATLAALEGGHAAAAFSSGSAATAAILQALKPGDHVISTDGFYGTTKLFQDVLGPWGLEYSLLDTGDMEAVRKALKTNTKMFWIETPSNPMMRISDIAALVELAHNSGAIVVCDNTFGTPLLQRPFDLGADYVMHSTTKYLSGHTDVLGGAIVTRTQTPLFDKVRDIQHLVGAVPSPFDCWLLRRGMKTLALRVERQNANGMTLAEYLSKHPKIESVLYAGLCKHPRHEIAGNQMRGFGGMISFLVKGDQKTALKLASSFKMIQHSTSLGGVESIVDHRYSVEPPNTATPPNLLRMSCGIEAAEDLIADFEQAFSQI